MGRATASAGLGGQETPWSTLAAAFAAGVGAAAVLVVVIAAAGG